MSTMGLDDLTFYKIEHALTHGDYSGNGTKWQLQLFGVPRNLNELGAIIMIKEPPYLVNKNNREYDGIRRLVGIWRANNSRAYHARYLHHDDVRNDRTPKYRGSSLRGDPIPPAQLLKSLQCLRYNLDNHQCPILNKIINAVKDRMIDDLPEYQQANWG